MNSVWLTEGDKSHDIKVKHEQKGGTCTNTYNIVMLYKHQWKNKNTNKIDDVMQRV